MNKYLGKFPKKNIHQQGWIKEQSFSKPLFWGGNPTLVHQQDAVLDVRSHLSSKESEQDLFLYIGVS